MVASSGIRLAGIRSTLASVLAVSTLTAPASCLADDIQGSTAEPLVTDRPGNGNAAVVVPRASVQIEGSAQHVWEALPGTDVHLLSFPLLLRYGLVEPLELRAGTGVVGLGLTDASSENGVNPTDTSLGTKLQILDDDGLVPDLSVGADVALPSGEGPFTADAVTVDARMLSAWSLGSGFGLLLNAGVDTPRDAAGRHVRFLHVTNVGYTLPPLEGRITVFVESFGAVPASGGRDVIQQLDWGAAFLVAPLLQLDAFAQHGLTSAAPDLQLSIGLSTRF